MVQKRFLYNVHYQPVEKIYYIPGRFNERLELYVIASSYCHAVLFLDIQGAQTGLFSD
jgi:hypothetical protein